MNRARIEEIREELIEQESFITHARGTIASLQDELLHAEGYVEDLRAELYDLEHTTPDSEKDPTP